MRGQNHADRDLLRGRYKGLADGDLVAYVDESYRLPTDCRPHETPFYAMSAVLLRVCDLDTIRDDLRALARSDYWHTTELAQSETGWTRIQEMLDYLARYRDLCVIAVRRALCDGDTQKNMRAICLRALMTALVQKGPVGPITWDPVSMVVLEKQRESKDTNRDRYTVSQARKEGLVPRNMFVHYVSPASEQLLWLPDLVAHTYRRYITHRDRRVMVLANQTVTLDLTETTSDPLAAAAYHQGVSLQFH